MVNPIIQILLTVIFGAVIGLETETRIREHKGSKKAKEEEKQRIGGVRTYTVLSVIGGMSGIFFNNDEKVFAYIIFIGILSLVLAAYIQNVQIKQAFGLTTEIAILITFLLGFFTTSEIIGIDIILIILIILTFFLSQKRGMGALIDRIKHQEVIDLIKFALISLVVLPILPNKSYNLLNIINFFEAGATLNLPREILEIEIINPFRIWLIVVVISGITLFSYMLNKFIDVRKGGLITAILGGFISSTSTTVALANKSKQSEHSERLAGMAIVANAISFISISLLISILNPELLYRLYPVLVSMTIIGIIAGLFFIKNDKEIDKKILDIDQQVFSIEPAIKFVGIIILITIGAQMLQIFDNEFLFISGTALAGTVGLDAPTIVLSELLNTSTIGLSDAVAIFLMANAINFVSKISIGYFEGSKEFTIKLAIGLAITFIGTVAIVV